VADISPIGRPRESFLAIVKGGQLIKGGQLVKGTAAS
jgi:hypothetical protein